MGCSRNSQALGAATLLRKWSVQGTEEALSEGHVHSRTPQVRGAPTTAGCWHKRVAGGLAQQSAVYKASFEHLLCTVMGIRHHRAGLREKWSKLQTVCMRASRETPL